MGGRAVYGYALREIPLFTIKQNHVIWQDDSGKLFDVTPVYEYLDEERALISWPDFTLFERDDNAIFDGKAGPTLYIAKSNDQRLVEAGKLISLSDTYLMQEDFENCIKYTDLANELVIAAGFPNLQFHKPDGTELKDVLKVSVHT